MKIQNIKSSEDNKLTFKGIRLDKKVVSQLSKNNRYSLSEPNQRKIAEAIKNLGEVKGAKNINFLLDTAAKSTYSTNIVLKDTPKNNWKAMLIAAATTAIALTPFISKQIKEKIAKLASPQELNNIEEEILYLRNKLLNKADLNQIKEQAGITAKDFEKNLDYLIISSETTLEHKKYVLERLNYFMSDEYSINPQLADKKSIALAEMVNDMAINVPGSAFPNIKAVDQKQHGMCAAISIVRKKLAYEDKPNYVDAIISELDDTNKISVYDRNALGSGKKIQVEKVAVDFATALAKGYRIIDASTMHWMQIAHMTGSSNIAFNTYIPFDKYNFDVNADSFYNVKIEDTELAKSQEYYQALVKAEQEIERYKARSIKKREHNKDVYDNFSKNIQLLGRNNDILKQKIIALDPTLTETNAQRIISNLINLEYENSSKLPKSNPFAYIPNEENIIKKDKIKNFLLTNTNANKIDNKTIDEIFSLIEYKNELLDETKKTKTDSIIKKASNLYEIAAAFRFQVLAGLKEKSTRSAYMASEKVPSHEFLVFDTIDLLINKLENGSGNSELIINQLAPYNSISDKIDKESTLEFLYSLKGYLQELITVNLDNIYQKIALTNRRNVYSRGLENLKLRLENCTKNEAEGLALLLNCKNDKKSILKAIDKYEKIVTQGNEADLKEISKLFGAPLELLINNFSGLIEEINTSEDDRLIIAFMKANNIPEDDNANLFQQKLIEIQNDINFVSKTFAEIANSLRIVNNDGEVLYSAVPEEVLIKQLENKKVIVPAKNLKILQEHLDKISKERSNDEFGTLRGKLKDKSLYQFSNLEKQTMKDTEERIDQMYAHIQKQLNKVHSDIKPMLEELKRYIGLNNGRYWVTEEGHSGLSAEKQVRILEYMTGRHHYISEDLKDAVEKIKNEPYSGIASTSVSHTQGAWHAQYVADITPVTIKEKDEKGNLKEVQKDILFNDNTWGVFERENTWIDSNGLMRTDYGSNRGGNLGYITNERYWNGNFVDRLADEMLLEEAPDNTKSRIYKKITHNNPFDRLKTTQFSDIILDGKGPKAKNISDQIHDLIFASNLKMIDTIEEISSKYTEEEIENIINRRKLAGKSWKSTYEELKKRIFPAFNDGIITLDDYNKLANDDYLKVVLEKIALKRNYQIAGLETDLAEVRNVKELSKYRAAQKNRALNTFKYAFGKNHMIVKHLADNFGMIQEFEIFKILEKHGIKLSDDETMAIASEFAIELNSFDGSVKNTINLLMNDFSINIDKIITNPDANKEIKDYLRSYLENSLYFNQKDINNKKIEHIIKFIDREYNPVSDYELVKIYRQIQDMTKEEFKKEILSKVKFEDLGIKNNTGFDILKQIQRYNEKTNTDFINTVYFDSLVKETPTKTYDVNYRLKKLTRTPHYRNKYDNLETIYSEFSQDLQLLTLPKLFNKYKAKNLEKYGAYPAYPKVNYLDENVLNVSYNQTMQKMDEDISTIAIIKNQLKGYNLNNEFKKLAKSMNPDTVLSEEQQEMINEMLTNFITLNYNNQTYMEIFKNIDNLLELPLGSKWKDYTKDLKVISQRLTDIEKTAPRDFLEKSLKDYQALIDNRIIAFSKSLIIKRYQNKITELLKDVKQAMIKGNIDVIEKAKENLYVEYEKAHILNDPIELLENYMKSQAKNSSLKPFEEAYKTYLQRGLQFAQLAEMQETLMEALSDGVAPNVKELFNTHSIEMNDGTSRLMGSKEMITTMVNQLLVNNNTETASMFIEKLGLAEPYIEHLAENLDIDGLKDVLNEAHSFAEDFNKFQNTINPYIDEAATLVNKTKRPSVIINSLKSLIKTAGDTYGISEESCVILLKALDKLKKEYKEKPECDRELLFTSIMNEAKTAITSSIQSQLEQSNFVLKTNATLITFIASISLKENSKAEKLRNNLLKKYQEVVNLFNTISNLQQVETSDTI